ncbi:MAG: hypothetical protein GY852_06850 [bacterium]|nr:hypothetical protein [bacterium]
MAKHAMLPKGMLQLFDFAAMNPIQGPLMTQQMMLPAVLLQAMEQQERELHRMSQSLAGDAEKDAQEHHEEKHSVSTEEASETEGISTTSFSLVYYNPETDEVQVIKEKVSTSTTDYIQKQKVGQPIQNAAQAAMALDQSVGQKSTYPLYTNVATPLARQVVDPIKLEIALNKIEIESPKPFGGSPGMIVAPEVFDKVEHQIEKEGIQGEIVAVETLRQVEEIRAETIHQVEIQIHAFEHVIEELEVTDIPMETLVMELPPLSKERYVTLLKSQKKIAETVVVDMLIADLEFLLAVKKRVKGMGLRDLLETIRKMGKIPGLSGMKFMGGGDDDDKDKDKEESKEE